MANAFWGGFAGTLRDSRIKDEDASRQLDRDKALQELKKKYESEIVDSNQTTIEGTAEVRRNKFGDEISRRELSPDELAAKKAQLDKISAEARRAGAEAEVSGKDALNYDADRQLSLEDKKIARDLQREQLAISRGHLGVAQQRLGLDRSDKKEAEAESVLELLYEADGEGDSSAMALADRYQMRLNDAKDEAERRRIIAEYRGVAKGLLNRIKQANRLEEKAAGKGFIGLDTPVLPGS